MVNFEQSKTRENLMRAFAGESQARNRYTFGASEARKQKQETLARVFLFTAEQEKEHAEIFYNHLKSCAKTTIEIDGAYPVDLSCDLKELLRMAQHNEYEEHDDVYENFGKIAREEGFEAVAQSFFNIAKIEKVHGDRFGYFANLMEQDKLHKDTETVAWFCMNCGYIYEGKEAPKVCPVCAHDQGYFVRLELAPYTSKMTKEF